jgi:uncharacterized protein DUF1524/excalibur calcium-binding domain-containing protein
VTRLLVLALLSLGLVAVPPAAPASAGEVVKMRLHRAVKQLPVARETRRGYDRDKFRHWVDADGDCRDTRDEVLADESLTAVSGCDVQQGRWRSYYDGVVVRDSSAFDVDHLVPLAEAWDSGAKRWTAGTRRAFANDLGDARSLVAVTASSNRSKSDQDPADWLPALDRCRYVREWTAVKIRWSLSVNRTEKRVLVRRAEGCRNLVVKVRRATVRTSTKSGGGSTGGSGGTDPQFDYCYQAKDAGYGPYYKGQDEEYAWYEDADGDGVVCE